MREEEPETESVCVGLWPGPWTWLGLELGAELGSGLALWISSAKAMLDVSKAKPTNIFFFIMNVPKKFKLQLIDKLKNEGNLSEANDPLST